MKSIPLVVFAISMVHVIYAEKGSSDEDMDLTALASESLCLGNRPFCDDPELYPSGTVQKIIREFRMKNDQGCLKRVYTLYGDAEKNVLEGEEKKVTTTCFSFEDSRDPPTLSASISNAFSGDDVDLEGREGQAEDLEIPETPVCPRYATYIYPKRGITKKNGYKFILNSPEAGERFQAVRVEICINPGQNCDFGGSFGFVARNTVCRQRFAYVRLLAVPNSKSTKNLNVENIELESFKFPTSCTCHRRASTILDRR